MPTDDSTMTVFDADNGPLHRDDIDPPAGREIDMPPFGEGDADLGGEYTRLDPETYQTFIDGGIKAAEEFIDNDISPDRQEAARYYRGEPFGNENGGSAVVMTEVRDAVLAQMPGLLRMFTGPNHAVEFVAKDGTPEEQAEQQTDYVNHVIMKDNPGFQIIYAAVKDALIRKTGVFTWWPETKEIVTETQFSGISEEALAIYQIEAEEKTDAGFTYEVVIEEQESDTTAELTLGGIDETSQTDQPRMLYSGAVRRRELRKKIRVAAMPPEEFICTPTTSMDLDEFQLVGRRTAKTISELVAMGHDEKDIRDAIGGHGSFNGSTALDLNEEREDRKNYDRVFDNSWSAEDPSSEEVKYCEIFVLVDYDGDGIAERRKVCTVGENNVILHDRVYDDDMVPFGLICPDPEPHSPFGYSTADQVMDIQEIKSEMVRGVLNSLANSLVGKTYFSDGNVNIDDLLNNEDRSMVRVKGLPSNMVMHQSMPFLGQNALPVLDYIDMVKTRRTGINPASPAGLDPESLQSTAKEGVGAMVDASQDRLEMIARVFAETGFSRLMKGVRNLIVRHQDKPRMLKLRGRMETVNPVSWDADLETEPNVGVGKGSSSKKLAGLQQIMMMQKEIIASYGITNPVVKARHVAYTAGLFIRELGFNEPNRFMEAVTPEMEAMLEKSAQEAAAKPTPEMLVHTAQMALIESNRKSAEEKNATAQGKIMLDDDRSRDAKDMDYSVAVAKILGDFGIAIDQAEVRRRIETNRQEDAAHRDASAMANDAIASAQPPQPPGEKGPQA